MDEAAGDRLGVPRPILETKALSQVAPAIRNLLEGASRREGQRRPEVSRRKTQPKISVVIHIRVHQPIGINAFAKEQATLGVPDDVAPIRAGAGMSGLQPVAGPKVISIEECDEVAIGMPHPLVASQAQIIDVGDDNLEMPLIEPFQI